MKERDGTPIGHNIDNANSLIGIPFGACDLKINYIQMKSTSNILRKRPGSFGYPLISPEEDEYLINDSPTGIPLGHLTIIK